MQVVTEENTPLLAGLVRVRNIIADPSAADPMLGVNNDPVKLAVLRVLSEAAEKGDDEYQKALDGIGSRLRQVTDRVDLAVAHERRVRGGGFV